MTRSKTVVITGCSSGVGRCTALELARHGWLVFATVRKEEDRASLLHEAEVQQCQGTISNVSSISGRLATPALGAYCASKFALEGLSEALRLELLPFGVQVVLIEPASSPTHIWKTSLQRSMDSLGWHLENSPYARLLHMAIKSAERSSKRGFPPQLFAALVVKILSSRRPRARYCVPGSATAIILLRRFLPDGIWDRLIRSMMDW